MSSVWVEDTGAFVGVAVHTHSRTCCIPMSSTTSCVTPVKMAIALHFVLVVCFLCSTTTASTVFFDSSSSRRVEITTADDIVAKVHSAHVAHEESASTRQNALSSILSAENMTKWWNPHPLYAYDALAEAATDFFDGAFLPVEEPQRRKREFAAFISHVLAETKLQVVEVASAVVTVDGKENKYCDRTYASCTTGKSYHGRGPLLMAGNTNYAYCSELLGLGSLLVIDPDRVARDAKVAWGTAICLWLKDDGLGSAQAHAMRDEQHGGGFGASTVLLKGNVECGPRPLKKDGDEARVGVYHATCKLLGLAPGRNVRCSSRQQSAKPSDHASAVSKLISKDTYTNLFPQGADLYAYEAFREAASLYPTFAASGDTEVDARELAAFLTQAAAATERFTLRIARHADDYDEGVFCDTPLESCLEGRKYHGRGPFMTTWSSQYARIAEAIGADVLRNPEVMAKDAAVAWKAALHVWMTDLGRGCPHDFVATPELLAQSSNILFGSLVCGSSPRDKRGDGARIRIYEEIMAAIGGAHNTSESALSCKTLAFDEDEELPPMARYLTESDFAALFPQAAPHFSYRTLVEATKLFPRFAGESDEASNRLEIAAFLAHAAVGSRNFSIREIDNAAFYLPEDFCDHNVTDCVPGRRYHGRGPFAISWNYNYRKCGDAIGEDLLRHPEYVYLDSLVMWKAALWQWMQHRPLPSYSSLHAVLHRHFTTREENFRTSSILVAGAQACGTDNELRRVELFNAIAQHLQLKPISSTMLRCKLTTDPKPSQVASILSAADFYDLTNAGAGAPLYDYQSFLSATALFPAFAGASSDLTNRRELAAFFAHAATLTRNFRETEDRAAAAQCSTTPCYYKRGPFMIEGDAMYSKLRRMLDKNVIQDPGLVSRDSDTAWQSALLVWMRDGGNGSAHELIQLSDFGFAASLRVLEPALCASNTSSSQQIVQDRVQRYVALCSVLGIAPEPVLSCLDPAFQHDSISTPVASNTLGLASILSKELFVDLFPDVDPLYTYNALLDAAAKFPAFANDGPDRQNRQEVAAFVAQMAHASGNFTFTQQTGWNLFAPSEYCDSAGASNYSCNPSQRYHGRGPIQLTWNYNYGAYGETIGVDLLNHPEWVATDAKVAWGSAIWYWMLDQGGGRGSIHDVFVRGTASGGEYDFARTTWLLNGGLECGSRPIAPEPQPQRIRFFRRYAARFHVEPGTRLSCHSGEYEPQKA